jgi:hypothetical protein
MLRSYQPVERQPVIPKPVISKPEMMLRNYQPVERQPVISKPETMLRNYQPAERQPIISPKAAEENMFDMEQPLGSEDEPHHFPSALRPSYDAPTYLRFFNESIEVTLKGDRVRRPEAAVQHATQGSDTLDDVDFEGETSLWGAFVRQRKQT